MKFLDKILIFMENKFATNIGLIYKVKSLSSKGSLLALYYSASTSTLTLMMLINYGEVYIDLTRER